MLTFIAQSFSEVGRQSRELPLRLQGVGKAPWGGGAGAGFGAWISMSRGEGGREFQAGRAL